LFIAAVGVCAALVIAAVVTIVGSVALLTCGLAPRQGLSFAKINPAGPVRE
jgi:hypothetical protein